MIWWKGLGSVIEDHDSWPGLGTHAAVQYVIYLVVKVLLPGIERDK